MIPGNPYAWTAEAVELLHRSVSAWAGSILSRAGLSQVDVLTEEVPPGEDDYGIVLLPEDMDFYPKGSEVVSTVPMLGRLQRDSSTPIPGVWHEISEGMVRALEQAFPSHEPKGTSARHLSVTAPVDLLPGPLRAWYHAQGESAGPDTWMFRREPTWIARLPTIEWQPGPMIRVRFICYWWQGGGKRDRNLSMAAMASMMHGLYLERSLTLRVPPTPAPPALLTFLEALAESTSGDERAYILDRVAQVRGPAEYKLSLSMVPEQVPTTDPSFGMYWRPSQPLLRFTAILPLGGGPIFSPTVAPTLGRLEPRR